MAMGPCREATVVAAGMAKEGRAMEKVERVVEVDSAPAMAVAAGCRWAGRVAEMEVEGMVVEATAAAAMAAAMAVATAAAATAAAEAGRVERVEVTVVMVEQAEATKGVASVAAMAAATAAVWAVEKEAETAAASTAVEETAALEVAKVAGVVAWMVVEDWRAQAARGQ